VLLIGFMGAGKTSVGEAVARRLGWRFLDFDRAIEKEAGMSVADLFRTKGEAVFRSLESEVGNRLLGQTAVVLASGGGWPVAEGRLESLTRETLTIWLRVSPAEAIRRARMQAESRPLLDGADPMSDASELLRQRERRYARAQHGVDTDGSTVEDVTARILEILATQGIETNAE
jgi:shikimate kinase